MKPVEARLAMFLARGPFANLASFIVWDKADMTSAREGRTVKSKLKYQGFFCKLNHSGSSYVEFTELVYQLLTPCPPLSPQCQSWMTRRWVC